MVGVILEVIDVKRAEECNEPITAALYHLFYLHEPGCDGKTFLLRLSTLFRSTGKEDVRSLYPKSGGIMKLRKPASDVVTCFLLSCNFI